MRTIRITITSPETANVIFKETNAKQLSLKGKFMTLFQKLSIRRETEKET